MSHERLRPTFAFTDELVAELKTVVPEAFADGKVDWDALQEALGEWLDDDSPEAEHFGLTWPGKRDARRLAAMPSRGGLLPIPGEGINEDVANNFFIEGDNLEVLKLLQKSYSGRVKMIYIDPPYNTGNDFVYKDNFIDPLADYLEKTGQINAEGSPVSTNTRADGRFHSNWLSMMYPRLRLARMLLRPDGLLFVSIDDTEMPNLRLVLGELFGEEGFVASIIWQKRTSPDARLNLAAAHDYILVFARATPEGVSSLRKLPLSAERVAAYQNPDSDQRGPWASVDLTGQTGHATPSQFYTIVSPAGKRFPPPKGRCWALAEATFQELQADNRIWFGKSGTSRPRLKRFLSESEGTTVWTWWPNEEVGHNQEATKELAELLGQPDLFNNPKPIRLLKRIVQLATRPDQGDIVLDFFAGSCSTAHAVLSLNAEDNGDRQSLSIQLPEQTAKTSAAYKAGFRTIADIGKQRLRRAIAATSPPEGNLRQEGFRVLRLGASHFRVWHDFVGTDEAALLLAFDDTEEPLVSGWNADSLLSEVMLLEGFPLNSRVAVSKLGGNATVREVTSVTCGHRLLACFDRSLLDTSLELLDLKPQDVFACLDSALSDEQKVRLADRCRLKTI